MQIFISGQDLIFIIQGLNHHQCTSSPQIYHTTVVILTQYIKVSEVVNLVFAFFHVFQRLDLFKGKKSSAAK